MRWISHLLLFLSLALLGGVLWVGFLKPEPIENVSQTIPTTNREVTIVWRINSEKLMENVNNWRLSQNLPKYETDKWLCEQADLRANDIQTDYSHQGFIDRYENKYDLGENLSENYSENYALGAWLNSPSHAKNLYADYKYSCIKCKESKCVQLFANL